MHDDALATYPPLNTPKRVAENIWIVDGSVIRLGAGERFIHSPTPFTPSLRDEIGRAGKVRFIVGPNCIHYWWIPEWKAAFPQADVYLALHIQE
jgi:hypothetical protein